MVRKGCEFDEMDELDSMLMQNRFKTRFPRYRVSKGRRATQLRALKELPTTGEAPPEPPIWAAIHEFDREVDASSIEAANSTEQAGKTLGAAKQVESVTYRLAKVHGGQRFFN